jgi:acylphosphatase
MPIENFTIVKINVLGKVQGVFYRQHTQEKASSLQLTGYVKNLSDGSVEIVAAGTKDRLDELITWCWQGSPSSRVANVLAEDIDPNLADINSIGLSENFNLAPKFEIRA